MGVGSAWGIGRRGLHDGRVRGAHALSVCGETLGDGNTALPEAIREQTGYLGLREKGKGHGSILSERNE